MKIERVLTATYFLNNCDRVTHRACQLQTEGGLAEVQLLRHQIQDALMLDYDRSPR